jgi:hypothetical protein
MFIFLCIAREAAAVPLASLGAPCQMASPGDGAS